MASQRPNPTEPVAAEEALSTLLMRPWIGEISPAATTMIAMPVTIDDRCIYRGVALLVSFAIPITAVTTPSNKTISPAALKLSP